MRRLAFVLVMLAALASCATSKPTISKVSPPAPTANPVPAGPAQDVEQTGTIAAGPSSSPSAGQLPAKSIDVPSISLREPETSTQAPKGKASQTGPGEQPYEIQVENMPIGEFVNLIFGKVLDANYSVDKSVEARKETVTLNMKATARQSEILNIAREVFKGYGLDITQKEGIYFIGPTSGQPPKQVVPYFVGNVPESVGGSDEVGLFLQVYHIRPQDFAGIATSLALSPQGKIQAIPGSTMFCIIDDANHAKAAAELIHALDRPSLSNKKMKLFYLHYLPVDTFVGYLAQAMPAQGIPVAKTPSDPGMMLIGLKQIRAVLAVCLKPEWFDQIGFWQEKLDLRTVSEDEPQFYVYHPKNRRASDLAKLFGGGSRKGQGQQTDQQKQANRQGQDVGPETTGMLPRNVSATTEGMEKSSSRQMSTLTDVMVSVDDNTNSLVITATPFQYARVEELLNRLDLLPRQVLIEVMIGEVTLTGDFQFGIEWAIQNKKGSWDQSFSTLGNLVNPGLSIGSAGFLYTISQASGNFQAVLNAFAKDEVLKVLSSPRIVVLDNEEANIEVGTEVPVLTSQATAGGVQQEGTTSLLQSIQYVKTGVIMTVKPTINSQGMLTLLIKQEVSDPSTNTTSDISSPSISTRKIDTSVALKSGTSIMLGGLIQNQTDTTVNKIPWLGDIPLIAPLFKTTSRSTIRTELFVVITPHILSTSEEAEDATRKFKELLPLFH